MRHHLLIVCLSVLLRVPVMAQSAAQEGYLPVGNLRLHFRVEGQGDAILLLHGGYLDMHAWDAEVAWLSKSYTVIRVDLPGHGQSSGADTSLLIADLLHHLLDSLQISSTSVMGLSLGASCAVEFTLGYPAAVRRLVLVSPGLSGWADVMKADEFSVRLFRRSDSLFKGKNTDSIAEGFTHLWCDGPYRKPSDIYSSVREYVLGAVRDNQQQTDRSWPVFNRDKAARHLGQIDCPTLILTGDKDVPFIDAAGLYYQQHISHAVLTNIQGVAHMINLERPELFQKIVGDFLQGN